MTRKTMVPLVRWIFTCGLGSDSEFSAVDGGVDMVVAVAVVAAVAAFGSSSWLTWLLSWLGGAGSFSFFDISSSQA